MNYLLIGNAIALLGSLVMIGIGFLKKKETILLAQCLQCLLMGVGNLVLGGFTGFLSNVVTIIRNLVAFKKDFTTPLKIIFILLQVIPAIKINTLGLIGWLPILAACVFTWYMDTKSDITFKIVIISTMIMWAIYDIVIQNYVAFTFDLFTIASNSYTLIKLKKES